MFSNLRPRLRRTTDQIRRWSEESVVCGSCVRPTFNALRARPCRQRRRRRPFRVARRQTKMYACSAPQRNNNLKRKESGRVSVSVFLKKADYNAAELFRQFEIHQMPRITDHHASRVGDSSFDYARVRMHIRYVRVPDKNQSRDPNFME